MPESDTISAIFLPYMSLTLPNEKEPKREQKGAISLMSWET